MRPAADDRLRADPVRSGPSIAAGGGRLDMYYRHTRRCTDTIHRTSMPFLSVSDILLQPDSESSVLHYSKYLFFLPMLWNYCNYLSSALQLELLCQTHLFTSSSTSLSITYPARGGTAVPSVRWTHAH